MSTASRANAGSIPAASNRRRSSTQRRRRRFLRSRCEPGGGLPFPGRPLPPGLRQNELSQLARLEGVEGFLREQQAARDDMVGV